MNSQEKKQLYQQSLMGYIETIPFHKVIGIELVSFDDEQVVLAFKNKPELVGNTSTNILHGGVVATALDAASGAISSVAIMSRLLDKHGDIKEVAPRMHKLATSNLRIDYIAPGKGDVFTTKAEAINVGNRSLLIQAKMSNEVGALIAMSTGNFVY